MAANFLTAEWKNLIMINYIVDAAMLENYIPYHTELDRFDDKVFISLVGFMFGNTRVFGVKIPFHINFEEVNLRFYVRHHHDGKWKRGTVFIKEIVPRRAISFIANNIYGENYCKMPMRHFLTREKNNMKLGYHWKYKGKWNRMEAKTEIQSQPMVAGSLEEFIAEHYWGYTKHSSNISFEYNVQHPCWEIYPVKDFFLECDMKGIYGNDFAILQDAVPAAVFVAKGSEVSVLHKRRL